MNNSILHILNGDSLAYGLEDLHINDDILIWREMLCEGATSYDITSEDFKSKRISFLKTFGATEEKYITSFFNPLTTVDYSKYTEIVVWFEYDLFCHINMIAALSHLKQLNIKQSIYLVCSGRIEGEQNLKGLSELTTSQLENHYKEKILLTSDDIELADTLWKLYCQEDHTDFKQYCTVSSSFPYLTNCISAHLKRFPSVKNGLNVLEKHILKIINKEHIKNTRQLTGYILQYQGYYGFGDLQIQNIIHKLACFFETKEGKLKLNRKGLLAIEDVANYYDLLADDTVFGGSKKYEYCYHPSKRILTKHE